jgi:hypothetical protein
MIERFIKVKYYILLYKMVQTNQTEVEINFEMLSETLDYAKQQIEKLQ